MCLNWRLCFFLNVGFLFQVLWLRPSTGDTLRPRPHRAAGRLQTDISRADRDFSLALAVLHAVDVASLALQHTHVREGILCRSAALKDCWLVELTSYLFSLCFVVCSVSGCFFFLFLLLVAAVDGARGMGTIREGGMEASAEQKDTPK